MIPHVQAKAIYSRNVATIYGTTCEMSIYSSAPDGSLTTVIVKTCRSNSSSVSLIHLCERPNKGGSGKTSCKLLNNFSTRAFHKKVNDSLSFSWSYLRLFSPCIWCLVFAGIAPLWSVGICLKEQTKRENVIKYMISTKRYRGWVKFKRD